MSQANTIPRTGLIALLARTFGQVSARAIKRSDLEQHAKPAVSVISDYGVAPSFPSVR